MGDQVLKIQFVRPNDTDLGGLADVSKDVNPVIKDGAKDNLHEDIINSFTRDEDLEMHSEEKSNQSVDDRVERQLRDNSSS